MTEPPVVQTLSAQPVAAQSPSAEPHRIDPLLAGFDHLVAMAGYVLLFVSVFMVGAPAIAALALAYAHKNDAHPLARSHFRFQLRIVWTAVLLLGMGLASVVLATGLGADWLYRLAAHSPALTGAVGSGHFGAWTAGLAGLFLVAAVLLTALAVLWMLGASLLGFLRLVYQKPIGQDRVDRSV